MIPGHPSSHPESHLPGVLRRQFLKRSGFGIGAAALSTLLKSDATHASGITGLPHLAPRAKQVICMHMVGAPSHLDLLVHKPALEKLHGQFCPDHLLTEGQQFAFIRGKPKLKGSPYSFKQYGESGHTISELLPHLTTIADEISVVQSLHTEEFNHGPAQLFLQTGSGRIGRPSMGSWVSYGLGSDNQNLPAFVVLNSGGSIAGAGSAPA